MKMDRESDQIGFDTLEKMTGFPSKLIKEELLGSADDSKSEVDLGELRKLMLKFIDRELLTTQK
jgi:hypothetical protein